MEPVGQVQGPPADQEEIQATHVTRFCFHMFRRREETGRLLQGDDGDGTEDGDPDQTTDG